MFEKITLPDAFCESMERLLGEEYPLYLQSFHEEPLAAIRVNTNKISVEEWKKITPFQKTQVAWTDKGFYYDSKTQKPAKHPYYYAGLYYIQEPSAMIPASLLPITKGDKVLDLCAAPGGKATELGAKLRGTGLLVANDISVSRTMALAKNLQFAGITNAIVTAEEPKKLRQQFRVFFDKILIDAPCSGEGMFRREPRMIKDWLEKGPNYYQNIQKEILSEAYEMLKTGGQMVYSTCTFSVTEDEEVIQWFLDTYDDMRICPVERKDGFSEGRYDMVQNGREELKHCVRIFPHKAKGEGHFAVLLQKWNKEEPSKNQKEFEDADAEPDMENQKRVWDYSCLHQKEKGKTKKARKERIEKKGRTSKEDCMDTTIVEKFCEELPLILGDLQKKNNTVSVQPYEEPKQTGLRIIYAGLPLLQWKYKILPSPQCALVLNSRTYTQSVNFQAEDERVIRYLKGESVETENPWSGNVLVCVDGYGLGWAWGTGGNILKNKYNAGWRYR